MNVNLWYLAAFFLEWELFQARFVEKIKTLYIQSLFNENSAVYEIMWKKCCTARQATEDNITRHIRFECWIDKAKHTHTHTHTHSAYVIIIAFPPRQLFRKSASQLRLYVHWLPFSFLLRACQYLRLCSANGGIADERRFGTNCKPS